MTYCCPSRRLPLQLGQLFAGLLQLLHRLVAGAKLAPRPGDFTPALEGDAEKGDEFTPAHVEAVPQPETAGAEGLDLDVTHPAQDVGNGAAACPQPNDHVQQEPNPEQSNSLKKGEAGWWTIFSCASNARHALLAQLKYSFC